MQLWKEDALLEETLRLLDESYESAYRYLLAAYRQAPEDFGPQTLYFLACLSGGCGDGAEALRWLVVAIDENGFWYRPEVLEDDDLAPIADNPAFLRLCRVSRERYLRAVKNAASICSFTEKQQPNLLLAAHGNTQNAAMAREAWEPLAARSPGWQLATVQSGTPDGFGSYRWEPDERNYLDFARAAEKLDKAGYAHIAWAGFSAGCDTLLRTLLLTPLRCDCLLLQSPWLPLLETSANETARALAQKRVRLHIFCGEDDPDCLPHARALYQSALAAGADAHLTVQPGLRHQFPAPLGDEYAVLP